MRLPLGDRLCIRSGYLRGRSPHPPAEGDLHPSPWALLKFKLWSGTETEHTWAGAEMGRVTVTPITVLARGERSS